ncbi:MAG TPA: hypothetical protein ENH51_03295 [Euryarchaeota archaeon]|nr:hypothetical protein [Euryarchaeota archaeon]
MKAKLLVMFIILSIFSGCIGQRSVTGRMVLDVGMTIDEFLDFNGLSLDSASESADRNSDGNLDIFIWDLDGDGNADVLIDIDENIQTGSHGTTLGFNKILIYDNADGIVKIAEVGKVSGQVRLVRVKSL